MRASLEKINGKVVKDNETYVLEDNDFLQNLTLSQTYLKPGKATLGHLHENQEEVYIFVSGSAIITIGDKKFPATKGDLFLIPKGHFHRVQNLSIDEPCIFTCVFEKYDRSGDAAKY